VSPAPETPMVGSSGPAANGKSETPSSPGSSSDFEDELAEELPPQPSPTSTSTAGPSRVFSADPAVFEKPIAGLVQLASLGVHYVRRAEPPLWLADDDDVADITAPLARIAARHVPVGEGQASDLADGFEAALATTNYVVKNIAAQAATRPHRPEGRMPEEPGPPPAGADPFPPPPATGP